MLGSIQVHAGDFKKGSGSFVGEHFRLRVPGEFWSDEIGIESVAEIEVASEESVKAIGGALGWGAAGGLLLGPAGLLAGLLAGGNRKQVTFVCSFEDGRKFLGTTDSGTWTQIMAAILDHEAEDRSHDMRRASWRLRGGDERPSGSTTWWVMWALGFGSLALLAVATNGWPSSLVGQSPAKDAWRPRGLDYEVVGRSQRLGEHAVDVRISAELSAADLTLIAVAVRDEEGRRDRALVTFYLPHQGIGSAVYATARFSPELEVKILRREEVDWRSIVGGAAGLVGRWFDASPYVGGTIEIWESGEGFRLEMAFSDGSALERDLFESRTPRGRRFNTRNGSGDHYLLRADGALEIGDRDGLVSVAMPASE